MHKAIAPPRVIGFWGISLFQINGMIGSGIFALPAVLSAAVGNFAPWMMLIGGAMFLPLVLVFAWLSTRFEGSGGPVLYGKAAFGSFAGFQAGWGRWASGAVAVAANTHVMVSYFSALFPALAGPVAGPATVFAVIVVLTIINLMGMKGSLATLGSLTFLKLVPLLVIVLAAVFGDFASPGLTLPEFSQTETVILLTFYAFIGFEGATVPAGEMRDPRRDVPRVLVTMLVGVTLIYVLVIWAYLTIAPGQEPSENPLASAAEIAIGPAGTLLVVFAAGFSIAANNFSSLLVIPRMAYGMAEHGMLPRWFAQLSPRFLTPANSILFYGAAAALLSLWGGFAALAAASTLTRLLTYLITAAALPVIERREGRVNRLHLAVAGLATAATVWIATHATAQSWTMFGALIAVGTVLYVIANLSRTRALET